MEPVVTIRIVREGNQFAASIETAPLTDLDADRAVFVLASVARHALLPTRSDADILALIRRGMSRQPSQMHMQVRDVSTDQDAREIDDNA